MSPWVLIIFSTFNAAGAGIAVHSVDMPNELSCRTAARQVVESSHLKWTEFMNRAICVERQP